MSSACGPSAARSRRARASGGGAPRALKKANKPLLASGALIAIVIAVWWTTRQPSFTIAARADRNVLLVTIDTLRADAMSMYGGRASTPRLDALAAHGARFTFAHAHAVVTLPSHTTLLTGTHPYEHGVRDNNGYRVRKNQATLATRLKTLGFATGAFVGGFPLDRRFGLDSGFDVYDDRIAEADTAIDFALPERRADAVVASALAWTTAQQGKWFAWVHVFDPHAPYRPPEEFARTYAGDLYAGEIAWTDYALGALFDRLAGLERPTLVIVTADHGESLGDHGELTHGIFAYESTLRVPLVVSELGARRTPLDGVTIDAPVRHIDIVPTVLEAIGAAADPSLPGASLSAAMRDAATPDRPVYFEAMTANLSRGWAPLRGVIAARQKYIDLPLPELYALEADPGESRNLVPSRRDRADVLLNMLRAFNVAPPAPPGEESSDVRDRLRALGYLGGSPAPGRKQYGDDDDPKRLIDIDALLHHAGDMYQRGNLEEAGALFEKAIQRRPDTADAYRYLAFVHWQAGRPNDAIRTLENALRNGITHRDVRVKLGLYLAETGQAARAIALLENLAGDDVEALNALGIAYGHASRNADASRTFSRILEIDPSNGLAWQNIGTIELRSGRRQEAEAALRRALDIDNGLPGAYTTLGVVLSESGRKTEAVDMWKRAVAVSPAESDALYNLTVTLLELGRKDEARVFGERYIATAPPGLFARDIARIKSLIDLK
jgi:arylsulfatase A-like enzyme/tetratricopeptide (TPR) repeat protein